MMKRKMRMQQINPLVKLRGVQEMLVLRYSIFLLCPVSQTS
jgi:hypothetical protein